MKTNSRNITLAKRGTAVLIPILIALAAALATSTVRAQSPADGTSDSDLCSGFQPLTMIVAPQTLRNGPLAKTMTSADGECSITVQLVAVGDAPDMTPPSDDTSCTVTATPALVDRGLEVMHSWSGNCGSVGVNTTTSLPTNWTASPPADMAGSVSGSSVVDPGGEPISGTISARIGVVEPLGIVVAWNRADLRYSIRNGRFTSRQASYDHDTVPWWRVVLPLEFTGTRPGVRERATSDYTFACCGVTARAKAVAYVETTGHADCDHSFWLSGSFIREGLFHRTGCIGRR